MEDSSNLGNSCFMLSALRCLFNTKELTDKIKSLEEQNKIEEDSLLGLYNKLLKSVNGDGIGGKEEWRKFRTNDVIVEGNTLGKQYDCAVFFQVLCYIFSKKYEDLDVFKNVMNLNKFEEAKSIKSMDVKSCYLDLSFSKLNKDDYLDNNIEKYFNVSLSKGGKLKKFFSVQKLSDVLVLKISDGCEKIAKVLFSKEVNFSYVQDDSLENMSLTYENIESKFKELPKKNFNFSLRSFIMYSGSGKSGHYISFCKGYKSEKWMKYDEISSLGEGTEKIEKDIEKIIEKGKYRNYYPYLLFYEKVQSKKKQEKLKEEQVKEEKESSLSFIEKLKRALLKYKIKMSILAAKVKSVF
jgi:hypothetical protein